MISQHLGKLFLKGSKHRLFAHINLIGLTVSLTAAILMFLFVQDETSYDKFWNEADKIARLETVFTPSGRDPMVNVAAPGPAKEALIRFFDQEIAYAARINNVETTIKAGDQYYLEHISMVDPEIQDIFDFDSTQGDIRAALADANTIVLSETLAAKYFGKQDPIGQTLTLNSNSVTNDYTVGAILKNLPNNTHLAIQALVPIIENNYKNSPWLFEWWFAVSNHTYFKLNDGYTMDHVRNRLVAFIDEANPDAGDPPSSAMHFNITNLADIHLFSSGSSEMKPGGSINIVHTFSVIALLVILIAGVNYMNLTTARACQRSREVALKKVMGASRRQLVAQFIGESLLVTFTALVFAVLLSSLLLPTYNAFLDKQIVISLGDPVLVISLLGTAVFLGVASAVYPALVISSYRPASVLGSNKFAELGSSSILRSALVVFQFAISIALIVATFVIYMQLQYFRSLDLGYVETNLLVVENTNREAARETREVLKQQALNLPMTESAAFMGVGPGTEYVNNTYVSIPGTDIAQMVSWMGVDHDFLRTYKIPLLAGRDYDENRANDRLPDVNESDRSEFQENIIVNQTLLQKLGLGSPEDAIGKDFQRRFQLGKGENKRLVTIRFNIIGVIPDIHMHSPRATILPTIYDVNGNYNSLVLRFRGESVAMVAELERIWLNLIPGVPFDYYIAENRLSREFNNENNQAILFSIFSFLAVGIGCLGLFGLASFVAERRTREIGLRKIMGANILQIIRLLLWQFSIPVVIANLIAWPTVAWLMHNWLSSFPYRIDSMLMIPLALGAGAFALLIAWLTVGGHAVHVARANPIEAIRHE